MKSFQFRNTLKYYWIKNFKMVYLINNKSIFDNNSNNDFVIYKFLTLPEHKELEVKLSIEKSQSRGS